MSLTSLLHKLTSRRAIAGMAAASATAATTIAPRRGEAAPAASATAFRYVTMFNYKPDTPEHIRREYERRWIQFMLACPQAKAPELNTPLPGHTYKPGQAFQYFSTIVFETEDDCNAYLNHPLHKSLHAEVVEPYADMPGVFGGRYAWRPCRDDWFHDGAPSAS